MNKATGTWVTLDEGAEVFGFESGRSFQRAVKAGRVLGVQCSGRIYYSEGMTGPIPGEWRSYLLPQGTKGVSLANCSGTQPGEVFVGPTSLPPEKKFPEVRLRTDTVTSGRWVSIIARFD
jgi:hypothetical protein